MKMWGGRFSGKLDPAAWQLNVSLGFDQRLAQQDVRGSLAWARGLQQVGLITSDECDQICSGLESIASEFVHGEFPFHESDEDIHTAVERRLGELIGPLAGKLHTGRSRNDQVATDLRLWLMEHIQLVDSALSDLQAALLECAEEGIETMIPGYTHLQRAQPLLLGHWWLSHFWPLKRDRERLVQMERRTAVLPLGAGALAGAPFPVDRFSLAATLGFSEPAPNSLDAVSDRDFVAEFLFIAAMIGVHTSRLAEMVILYTSAEFGFFELSDQYATGSSLMPQKKNPDMFELARGKAGTLLGKLVGLLATLKGLPSAYDKDLQEDKLPVFEAYDVLVTLLPVLAGALRTLEVKPERMRAALDPAMLATDLADYLVDRGVSFRQAHQLVGQAVRVASERGAGLDMLPLVEYQQISSYFADDVYKVFDPRQSIARRTAYGGTAPQAVREQLQQAQSIWKANLRKGSV